MACIRATTAKPIRIVLVDDAKSVRRALRHILGAEPDFAVIGEAADGESAMALATALRPDIILMDFGLPGINGTEAARRIHAAGNAGGIVMLTAFGADEARAAADAGIALFLEKGDNLDDLAEHIRSVHARTIPAKRLSKRTGVSCPSEGSDSAW